MPDIDFGDAPAWVAIGMGAGGLIVSLLARRDSKKSSNAAVAAVAEARRSSDASERSAAAAEQSLALQREEAAARRAAEGEAARPRVQLAIDRLSDSRFCLVNKGTAAALHIVVSDEGIPYAFGLARDGGVSLQPGEARAFQMAGGGGRPIPPQIFVRWDGQEELVPLRIPPR